MKNNAKNVVEYLRAGFSGFWIPTPEPHRVDMEIKQLIEEYEQKDGAHWTVKTWRCTTDKKEEKDPTVFLMALDTEPENTVYFLHNFHWFLEKNKMLVQVIQDMFSVWANAGKAIVVVSPSSSIPQELQKYFTLLEMHLPDDSEIEVAMTKATGDVPKELLPKDCERKKIIRAARGLTMNEAENCFSLSLIEHGGLTPETINDYKTQTIAKSGFLEVIPPTKDFSSIIGYDEFKQSVIDTFDDPRTKGSLMIGGPGTGKTSLLYGIAGQFRHTLVLKVVIGKLFSKYVGETDANVDYVINLIKRLGSTVTVIIDEFEKQFAGVGASGDQEGHGTTIRANSRWLEFFQDRPPGIKVYGTANTFAGIPPEYLRAGRWDTAPYFVGLPNVQTRTAILKYYLEKNNMKVKGKEKIPAMNRWTGADIEAMVTIASIRKMSLTDAAKYIRPQAITHKDKIDALENWAKDNCIPAEEAAVTKGSRKLDI